MVGLLGLDELAEVFQCQLHPFSGKRQKHPASTYSVCSDFRLSICPFTSRWKTAVHTGWYPAPSADRE